MQPRLALLINPLSGYNRRHGGVFAARAERAGIECREGRDPDEIAESLRSLARLRPDLLIVNGGDGTVRQVVDELRRERPFENEPVLALLRGGSTNMIQNDAGLRGRPTRALRRLLGRVRDGIPQDRVRACIPLRIRREGDGLERHGFFWSAGALPRVLDAAQAGYAAGGARGAPGELAALAGVLKPLWRGAPEDDERLRPEPMGWGSERPGEGGGETDWDRSERVFLFVTTLRRLVLGFRAGALEGEPLRWASLRPRYRRRILLRYLLSGGRLPRASTGGLELGGGASLHLWLEGDWALDGETWAGSTAHPELRLEAAAPVRVLID